MPEVTIRFRFRIPGLIILLLPGLWSGVVQAAEPLRISFPQVLQRVMDNYPSLRLAQLQVERARQEIKRVESTLGWNLNGQGGLNRQLSFLLTPSDIAEISAGLQRQLRSGDSIGISGSYRYEDSTTTFSPAYPNPSQRSGVELNYRMPFGRGEDNPVFQQGLVSAEAGILIEKANQLAVRDQLARQTLELFYSTAKIHASLDTARSAVTRAQRLKKYIRKKITLGLAEKKDVLQAEAQLQSRLSDVKSLQISWQQARTTLNRLMGRAWDAELIPDLQAENHENVNEMRLAELIVEAEKNSPDLLRNQARIKLSEAEIIRRRDTRKDKVDVVFSLGAQTISGDTAYGNIDDKEMVGGVRLEYQQSLDKSGLDAGIYQAQLDKKIAEENILKIKDDLRYSLASLVAEIEVSQNALKRYTLRLRSEDRKFKEALERYKSGRTETDRLIQYENELQLARFALEEQRIAYEQRLYNLRILRGDIWKSVVLPEGVAKP